MKTHILKPRLDASGAPPSVKAQQQAALEKKKKKPEGKDKLTEREGEGEEREDGGPGSGPQPGGGPERRTRGKFNPRRGPASKAKVPEGQKEKRGPLVEGQVGRRKIKVTPQIVPLSGRSKLIKTRL